jgi:hypothetical protein
VGSLPLWLVFCWEYPPAALPLLFLAVGCGVTYTPEYDEAGVFNRRRREQLATACFLLGILCSVGLFAWWFATHPGD